MRVHFIAGACVGLLGLGGCGQSVCEQVADQKKAVADDYCSGKDDLCWFCKCHNAGQQVKTTVEGSGYTFSCVASTEDDSEAACEGTVKDEALACLDDEASCIVDEATLAATSKCSATR